VRACRRLVLWRSGRRRVLREIYVHSREFLRDHLAYAGVIVPRDQDVARLRRWLQATTPSQLP
jgi:hypothetical protein